MRDDILEKIMQYMNSKDRDIKPETVADMLVLHGIGFSDLVTLLTVHGMGDPETKTFIETVLIECGFHKVAGGLAKKRFDETTKICREA